MAIEKKEMKRVFDEFRALSDEILKPDEPKKDKFIAAFRKMLDKKENWTFWLPIITSLDLCVKCNTCADACPFYTASGKNPKYHPVYRSDMLRRIYKKHFTLSGKIFGSLVGAKDVTEEEINALAESAYRCSVCRRCAYVCPIGVDNGLITRETRKILYELGIAPDEIYHKGTLYQKEYGNATKTPSPAFLNTLEFIKEDLEDEKGIEVEIPVDKVGADYLVINNAGDYFAFLDTIVGQVEVLNAAGIDWTYNTPIENGTNDVVNYGLFFSDKELADIGKLHLEVVKKLKPKTVVVGECGHAYEALKFLYKDIYPEWRNVRVISIIELFDELIRTGKIKVDPEKNPQPVTYHDPCKLGRLGGLYDEPRRILKSVCKDFREMEPNKEMSVCCGGGGGFAIMHKDDFMTFRMETYGKIKADQIRETEAEILALACSNCKGQFREIINWHDLDVEWKGIAELVANALVYD